MKNLDNPDSDYADDKYAEATLAKLLKVKDAKSKLAKASVDYTDKGTIQEHCSICTHYEGQRVCEVVEGDVRSRGWCKKFELHSKEEN